MNCVSQLTSFKSTQNNISSEIVSYVKNAFYVGDIDNRVIPILLPIIQLANSQEFIRCTQQLQNIQHHLRGMKF